MGFICYLFYHFSHCTQRADIECVEADCIVVRYFKMTRIMSTDGFLMVLHQNHVTRDKLTGMAMNENLTKP